jgi:trehalose-phosphatase
MRLLNPAVDLDKFFLDLIDADSRLLVLDYDGTLAPFHTDPRLALPYDGVLERLEKLMASHATRVVIVSGRAIADLKPLLHLKRLPELWGSHGGERLMTDNAYRGPVVSPESSEMLSEAFGWAQREGFADRCERKPPGITFHWRGFDQEKQTALRSKVLERWASVAERAGLQLHSFDGGLELRLCGVSKRVAVQKLIEETGGYAKLAYLGDDFTDEDAFAAVPENGLRVLVRREWRETGADLWIRPPEELLDFLDRWLNADIQ